MPDEREPPSARHVGAVIRLPSQQQVTHVVERAWEPVESSIPPAISTAAAKSGSGRLLAIAAGVAVAAGAFLLLGFRADSQLSYELRGASARGGLIEAERGEATVSLSDGSSILAENRSKFSVDVVGRNAALTRLVSGRLHVRVEHNEDTSYRFLAGPYEVRVVGTEFDLAWDPDGAGLSLAMSKGEVRLAEPGGKLRTLRAGQTLSLPGSIAALPAGVEPPLPRDLAAVTSWEELVSNGQFADVVSEAETIGVDDVAASRSVNELKALGQAARYVGKRGLALRAFTALQERTRGTDSAAEAAILLASLQQEQGNQTESR
jgi:ferric-dicitrate binding protein FerR (iron transport regulator)